MLGWEYGYAWCWHCLSPATQIIEDNIQIDEGLGGGYLDFGFDKHGVHG